LSSGRSKANERFDFTFGVTADDFKPRILLLVKFWRDSEFHSSEKTGVKNKSKRQPKQNNFLFSNQHAVCFFFFSS
jgi:hypothetical protein